MTHSELGATLRRYESALANRSSDWTTSALADLLSDSFTEFGQSGRTWTKSEVVEHLLSEDEVEIRIADFRLRRLDDDVALVTYVAVPQSEERSLRSSVWTRQDGDWRMVFHQGTTVHQ